MNVWSDRLSMEVWGKRQRWSSLNNVPVDWFPSLCSNRCKRPVLDGCMVKQKWTKWEMATHSPVNDKKEHSVKNRHNKRPSSGKPSSLLFCSWHVFFFLLFFSFFYLSDSAWHSSYFSTPILSCTPRSRALSANAQKHSPASRSRMGFINSHCTAKRLNKRPSYQYRCSSSVWYLKPCAAFRYGSNLGHDRHSGR